MKTYLFRTTVWLCAALCLLTFGFTAVRADDSAPSSQMTVKPTGKVEGTVVDLESGKALANALICIEGCRKAAMTNQYGKFYLEEVPVGPCCMKVSKRGYQKVKSDIDVLDGQSTKITVKLQTETNSAEESPQTSQIYQQS